MTTQGPAHATTTKGPAAKRSAGVANKASERSSVGAKIKPNFTPDAVLRIAKSLEDLRLRSAAAKLIAGRRKDLDAIVAANRKSFEGIQAVVKKQTKLLKDRIGEWRTVMELVGPQESIAHLDELAKQSLRMPLANMRELADLSVKMQAEAFEVVKTRISQNIAEVSALLDAD